MGGVASVNGVEGFGPEAAKDRLFEIYIYKMNALLRLLPALLLLFLHLRIVSSLFLFSFLIQYAKPEYGIGFPGAFELIKHCQGSGLKVAVASSADRIKVNANLAAAGLSLSLFDAVVSADAFENLKPAPDIFLAAAKNLNVPPSECLVIEDALEGMQAAQAEKMRCVGVKTTLIRGAVAGSWSITY